MIDRFPTNSENERHSELCAQHYVRYAWSDTNLFEPIITRLIRVGSLFIVEYALPHTLLIATNYI